METGSNKLYIDNCYSKGFGDTCTDPLIYGEFDNRILKLDGSLGIGVSPAYDIDVSAGGTAKSQLHFSLAGADTGGWITSVEPNNFWLSSGAAYNAAAGGWVQKSSDGLAVIAGSSGNAGYRVFTREKCPVGLICTIVPRMIINYSGQVGFGIGPSYPLHMASGALVTVGGVWMDASSRDYKEDIQQLSAAAAMNTLQGLNPVTFKYKAGEEERHVGFIAEDVPELVATKDRKGMSPMDVVAVLTRVVKEQQDTVNRQQQAIQEQQQRDKRYQEAIQQQQQINRAQQEAVQEQQEINRQLLQELTALKAQQQANQELMQKLTALEAEVNSLRQSGADGRLARIAK